MNLTKLLKVIEFAWPFIKEIVLDKDAPKADRRKKGVVFSLLTAVVFMTFGMWSYVYPYVQPFLPPNQSSTPSQTDRTRWVRFLENQMAEQVTEITELNVELNTTKGLLEQERTRVLDLEEKLAELEGDANGESDSPPITGPPNSGPDLFDQLNELRDNR